MNNYNKKQKEAIEKLLWDLDELDNKPQRLFNALEEFALSFKKDEAIPSIREAQDFMYAHIREGEYYEKLFETLRSYKIELYERKTDSELIWSKIKGVNEFIKMYIDNLLDDRLQ